MENNNGNAIFVTDILKKMPPRSQANSLKLDPILDVFLDQDGKELYPTELMLISQIIPFMFIIAKHTSEQ